jgi:hypothetical protein
VRRRQYGLTGRRVTAFSPITTDVVAVADEFDLVEQWYIGRCCIVEPPPLRWSTMLGDAIQNTRSALDHLVYQLVALSGNDPKRRGMTQWPIVSDKDDYWKGKPCGKPRRDTMLSGVAEKYRKLIDPLQPYNDTLGSESPFAMLNRLSNADKHRLLHAGLIVARRGRVHFHIPHPALTGRPEIVWPDTVPEPLHDKTELYRWRCVKPGWHKAEVQVNPALTFGVAFGQGASALDVSIIQAVCAVIRQVIAERFDPEFPARVF